MVSPLQSIVAGAKAQDVTDIRRKNALTSDQLNNSMVNRQAQRQQMDIRGQQAAQQQQQISNEQDIGSARYLNSLGKTLLASDEMQWPSILGAHVPQLQKMGYSSDKLRGLTRDQVNSVIQQTEPLMKQAQQAATTGQRETSDLVRDLTGATNPKTGKPFTKEEARQEVALRKSGIVGRSGIDAEEYGKREASRLDSQFGRKAGVAKEVKLAEGEAAADLDKTQKAVAGEKTYKVFNIALDNLSSALGATSLTGPIAGRLPASTTAAQIADAGKAIMLPVLKNIFREAGEGVFTDSDQRALEALLPRREQTKEAQLATMDAVEMIVKAKLGVTEDEYSGPDMEAYSWAKSNPNDPRSAAILKKIGAK